MGFRFFDAEANNELVLLTQQKRALIEKEHQQEKETLLATFRGKDRFPSGPYAGALMQLRIRQIQVINSLQCGAIFEIAERRAFRLKDADVEEIVQHFLDVFKAQRSSLSTELTGLAAQAGIPTNTLKQQVDVPFDLAIGAQIREVRLQASQLRHKQQTERKQSRKKWSDKIVTAVISGLVGVVIGSAGTLVKTRCDSRPRPSQPERSSDSTTQPANGTH